MFWIWTLVRLTDGNVQKAMEDPEQGEVRPSGPSQVHRFAVQKELHVKLLGLRGDSVLRWE